MMITVNLKGDIFTFEQHANNPLVYLDNWAFNKLSKDTSLSEKFINIMISKNGTLMCSSINIFEIARKDDSQQIEEVIKLLENIDFAFIELNSGKVISREKDLRRAGISFETAKPWSADRLLEAYVLYAHDFMSDFNISHAIRTLRDGLNSGHFITEDYKEINELIQISRKDSNLLTQAKKTLKTSKLLNTTKPFTEDLYQKGISYLTSQEKMKMPDNEWRDFFQIFVPVAYCDFVLLDSRWFHFVDTTNLHYPEIAKVYKNVKDFLEELEQF